MSILTSSSGQAEAWADAHAQSGRRKQIVSLTSRYCQRWYDSEGNWIHVGPEPDTRKSLWLCFGLLAGDEVDIRLANQILNKLEFLHHTKGRKAAKEAHLFDIFCSNHSLQLLLDHRGKLEPGVRAKLDSWARSGLNNLPGNRQPDYQFHGFNDNMPAKATLGMILGGEYFHDADAVAHGLWNLNQLKSLLMRRGLISEYNSPTYTPLTLVNLGEIAHFAKNREAASLAEQCCERVWADVLGHFHTPTGMLMGPYSRAYQLDSTGHFSTMACLLWYVLGDVTAFDPIEELERDPMRLVHHHNDKPTQLGILSWVSCCRAYPPGYLLEWLRNRAYPYRFHADAERGGESAGVVHTTSYAEEDFALGTAEGESWSELQSETCFLQYRLNAPMRGIEDLRTLYVRYLIEDQTPGDEAKDHLLKPMGLTHTVQKDRVAMTLVRPSLTLSGIAVSQLKFSIILPEHFVPVDSVTVMGDHAFIQDGPVYLALRALNSTRWLSGPPVRVESVPHYRQISLYNYDGVPRSFTKEELSRLLNGVILVVGLKREESFEQFKRRVLVASLWDYAYIGCRNVKYQVGGDTLEMSYHVKNDRVRYIGINGKSSPKHTWMVDGLPCESLPFFEDSPDVDNRPFPFKNFNLANGTDPWLLGTVPGQEGAYPISEDHWMPL